MFRIYTMLLVKTRNLYNINGYKWFYYLVACLVKRKTRLVLDGSTRSWFYGGFSPEKNCRFHWDCCPGCKHQMMVLALFFGWWFSSTCCTGTSKSDGCPGCRRFASFSRKLQVIVCVFFRRLEMWMGTSRSTVPLPGFPACFFPETSWHRLIPFGNIALAMVGIQVIFKDPEHGLFMMVQSHTSCKTNKQITKWKTNTKTNTYKYI